MTIRIGKISYWHVHAWDYTKQAQAHPDTEIVAVWDEQPARGREAAGKLGARHYESLNDLLDSDIDAVIVDAPTSMHHEIMLAAAQAGKHIFTEKVLAPTTREANEIIAAVNKSGVKLTVSLPRLNEGYTLAIREILSQGLLGQTTLVRVRLSHHGAIADWLPQHFYSLEQCHGGALIDLGCHPMYLARLFLGEDPLDVVAQFGYLTGREVEDNAAVLLKTESGAIGVVEAGFVNTFSPFAIEVHGTEGTVLFGTHDDRLLLRTTRSTGEAANTWTPQPLPSSRESAFHQWVGHIRNHTAADENIQLALSLTRLMEASYKSVHLGRAIQLDECIE